MFKGDYQKHSNDENDDILCESRNEKIEKPRILIELSDDSSSSYVVSRKWSDDDSDDTLLPTAFPKHVMVKNNNLDNVNESSLTTQPENKNDSKRGNLKDDRDYESDGDMMVQNNNLDKTNESSPTTPYIAFEMPQGQCKDKQGNKKSEKGQMIYEQREDEALQLLASLLLSHGLVLESMKDHESENTSADAFMRTKLDSRLIGVQITRSTFDTPTGFFSMAKDKNQFINMLTKGFIFISAVFVQHAIIGAALWLPSDISTFIESPYFRNPRISIFSKRKLTSGLPAKIFYPFFYCWANNSVAMDGFINKLLEFTRNPDAVRYDLIDLQRMIAPQAMKEYLYIERFRDFIHPVTGKREVGKK